MGASKAIVKDGSNLSVAKLLVPIVDRSGTRVAYNFDVKRNADTDGRQIMHVGLFEKGCGFNFERTFQEGWYGGGMDNAG
jgi:hypothetical protein